MATREEIKEIVYDVLLAAADGHVPEDNVSKVFPQDEEDLPAIVYQDDYRPMPINGASASPVHVEYDSEGFVVYEEFREYIEGIFTVSVRATNDTDAETIYERVHRAFGQFTHRYVADVKDLHEDINRIEVSDVNDVTDGDTNVPSRGDSVQVFVQFHRHYRVPDDEDPIHIEHVESNTEPLD